jgi:hypothetical protein
MMVRPTDHHGNNSSDNDDDCSDDQHKPKCRRGHDTGSRNPKPAGAASKNVQEVTSSFAFFFAYFSDYHFNTSNSSWQCTKPKPKMYT